jgi:hypothetical protein
MPERQFAVDLARDRIFPAIDCVPINRLAFINEALLPEDLEKAFGLSLPALDDFIFVDTKGDTVVCCEFLQLFLGMVADTPAAVSSSTSCCLVLSTVSILPVGLSCLRAFLSSIFRYHGPESVGLKTMDCLGAAHSNNQPHLQTELSYGSPSNIPSGVHQCANRPSTILRQPFSVSFADSSILIRRWIVSFASPSVSSGLKLFARPKPEIKPIRANSKHQNNQNTMGFVPDRRRGGLPKLDRRRN